MIEENGGGSLYRIRLLGYFAAAGADENGYLVVPNGSGSLIYFNNGKSNVENYSQYIYDIDPLSQIIRCLKIHRRSDFRSAEYARKILMC